MTKVGKGINDLLWTTFALALVIFPHALRLSPWVVGCFLLLAGWRAAGDLGLCALPDRKHRLLVFFKHVLAVFVFTAVYLSYGGFLGKAGGSALLVALVGFKLLEIRGKRDYFVLCFIGYFLIITNFLFSQSIPAAVYMLVTVTVLTATLILINDANHSLSPISLLRKALTMVAQSVPIMLIAFLLFPRVPGPLWGLANDPESAVTGISDEMAPGTISNLSRSDKVAFRAHFHGKVPPAAALYWRGTVFWDTDGYRWRDTVEDETARGTLQATGVRYDYTVTLEPHNQRWLFALEMPGAPPQKSRLTKDLQILRDRPVQRRMRYSLSSYSDYYVTKAGDDDLERALRLPDGAYPRTVAVAKRWRERFPEAEPLIAHTLRLFNEEAFYYTLSPPRLGEDSVDQFLFSTRAGYCEHYAAAFTVIMRAAGIPARIVAGYQGGEFNPIGDYVIVRQRDAHSWTEVWLPQRGWVRVDPTAAVAPARIERGVDAVIPLSDRLISLDIGNIGLTRTLWRTLRNAVDAINNGWNQWVLGFGATRQLQLMSFIGLDYVSKKQLAVWVVIASSLTFFVIVLPMLLRRPVPRDPMVRCYDRFCRKLAKAGIYRSPHEGPVDFARRIGRVRDDLALPVRQITDVYVRARYASEAGLVDTLRALVSRLRVRKGPSTPPASIGKA